MATAADPTQPCVHVLVVEDDEVEIMALRRALKESSTPHTLEIARDGMEALAKIRGEGCEPLEKPSLIFLDLNMPRMNGHEFLRALRSDPQHSRADVVVVTTSTADTDQRNAFESSVSGYIVKSSYGESFRDFSQAIDAFVARAAEIAGIRQTRATSAKKHAEVGEILVVDDDAGFRETMCDVLRDEGYVVRDASDGDEALELLRTGYTPRLVLLDLMLQNVDGFEFRAKQLADARVAKIPVVIMSGASDIVAISAALRATDYLRKPFDTTALVALIDKHVSSASVEPVTRS